MKIQEIPCFTWEGLWKAPLAFLVLPLVYHKTGKKDSPFLFHETFSASFAPGSEMYVKSLWKKIGDKFSPRRLDTR